MISEQVGITVEKDKKKYWINEAVDINLIKTMKQLPYPEATSKDSERWRENTGVLRTGGNDVRGTLIRKLVLCVWTGEK